MPSKGKKINTLPADIGKCTGEEFANGLKFKLNGHNSVAVTFPMLGEKFRGTGFNINEAYASLLTEIDNFVKKETK